MSNYVLQQDQFQEEEQFQSNNVIASHSQSSNGSPINTATETAPTDGPAPSKRKKRNLPGNPDPEAEVVALSPRTLMATNRYTCEVCLKGFQRDQNLQLHRRGHNLPWKLKQRPANEPLKKRVYICPEPSCVHHEPARALGDLTGIKKHFCRKHGEKKWKCDKCSKRYAVQSDWKAHAKICGTREYQCDCGTIFSRKDSFVTHRAFCDALTDENNKMNLQNVAAHEQQQFLDSNTNTSSPFMMSLSLPNHSFSNHLGPSLNSTGFMIPCTLDPFHPRDPRPYDQSSLVNSAYTSATALLQKAAEMGAKTSDNTITPMLLRGFSGYPPVGQVGPSLSGQVGYMTSDPTGHHGIGHVAVLPEGTESRNSLMGGGEMFMGGNEKMTVDFLGVDHANRSYEASADHGFHSISDW